MVCFMLGCYCALACCVGRLPAVSVKRRDDWDVGVCGSRLAWTGLCVCVCVR